MSEKTAAEYAQEIVKRDGGTDYYHGGWAREDSIEEAIAAAEERGRRRGVEERDNALKAAHEYCLYMFRREWLENPVHRNTFAGHIFAILDVARTMIDSNGPASGSLAVGKALADLAEQECENGIEAVGETCIASARDPDNIGESDYRFQHWCGPCIASTLIAEGSDEATADAALAPRGSALVAEPTIPQEGPPCSECGGVFGTHSSWCHGWGTATNNPYRSKPRDSGKEGQR